MFSRPLSGMSEDSLYCFEELERRRLLATITGPSPATFIEVQMSGSDIQDSFNGGSWSKIGTAGDDLLINAGVNNDTIQIDSLDAGGVTINGGAGSDSIVLDDISAESGTVYVNGYAERPTVPGSWDGDTNPDDLDRLQVGDGDIHDFPNVTFDPGGATNDDETITPQFAVINIDDHNDTSNEQWTIGDSTVHLNNGDRSPTITDVSQFISEYHEDPEYLEARGLNITAGNGIDTVSFEQDLLPETSVASGTLFIDGSKADSITLDGGDGVSIVGGDGNDTITDNNSNDVLDVGESVLDGGDGDDLFNFQDQTTPDGSRPVSGITAFGDAGNDTFIVGSRNHTLYGIGDISIYGNDGSGAVMGSDTLTVDDSNYNSTDSYAHLYGGDTNYDDSGAHYSIGDGVIETQIGPSDTNVASIGFGQVALTKFYTQNQNETDTDVHPTIDTAVTSQTGEVDLYPGSPMNGGAYDYNVINVKAGVTSGDLGTYNPLHIEPSESGIDQVTIGGFSGGFSGGFVIFSGQVGSGPQPGLGSLTINSNGGAIVDVGAGNDFSWGSLSEPATSGARGSIDVKSGIVTFGSDCTTIGTLTIGADGEAVVSVGQDVALAMASLSIASGGVLNLTNSSLIINNPNLTAALATLSTVDGLVSNANDDFAFDQWGITSSTAKVDVDEYVNDDPGGIPTELGVILNNDGTGPGGNLFYGDGTSLPQFGGKSVNEYAVLIKYTYVGDADLSGSVDSSDFSLFQVGYTDLQPYDSWAFGDFDYSGVVDSTDFSLFQTGYTGQGDPL